MSGVTHPPPDPIPHSVAETLQVTTDGHPDDPVGVTVTTGLQTQPLPASSIPSVGASISVSDSSNPAGLAHDRSSSALLSLASSCSLTEILNAQQQALEQFQCQLQLAQQTEAINQRLDTIERTLNSLIQQKAQEDAAKNAAVAAAAAAVVNNPINAVQLRPSQHLQLPSPSDITDVKRKLPRELCVSRYYLRRGVYHVQHTLVFTNALYMYSTPLLSYFIKPHPFPICIPPLTLMYIVHVKRH